ncbi:beta-casein-like [Dromiciops gliroides]|uniref:beta-casein-like n=1 Tax=Dromiciops gliroides TaxID=33562 RepID=UPI001CC59FED|nr:beta-casein-like [Dromiciops gliroides]
MKLLILTCLVALAAARPMVEKTSESEERITDIPEKHLKRRENSPVKNEHRVEIDRYLLPENEMMNLYYQPFYWSEEMRNLKLTTFPKDKRMSVVKSIVSDEVLPSFQQKSLSLSKPKVLSRPHPHNLPFHSLKMVPISHKLLTIPKQEMLPVSERESLPAHERESLPAHERESLPAHERESLSAHERENLSAHEREILLALRRELPLVPEREIVVAPERMVLPEQEREILVDHEREVLPVRKREILPLSEKEKILPLSQRIVLPLSQRDIVPSHQRDTITRRDILPVVQREVMPEVVALEVYPFLQPVANFYYSTEVNEVNSFIMCHYNYG